MSELHLVPKANPTQEERALIGDGVDEFNMAVTEVRDWHPVNIFLCDGDGAIHGGILADIWGGWLHIRTLFVASPYRRQRHGDRLLRAAEATARAHGCRMAHVETFSFQARPFYEKHGYEVFAELKDYPPGHSYYYLKKALT